MFFAICKCIVEQYYTYISFLIFLRKLLNQQTLIKTMFKTLSFLLFISVSSFSFGSSLTLDGDGDTLRSYVHYDMNACDAFVNAGTLRDYSEFIGTAVNDPNCATIFPMGTLYRTDPNTNTHSCTPGVDGTVGMCVSAEDNCDYDETSNKAVKIEIMLSPGSSGSASLSGLSFYEAAPSTYVWNSGPTGPNDPPTLYAVRVLRDGNEIYRSDANATTSDWTLEEFDFTGLSDFTVNDNTFFTFELLGYCLEGNGADVAAWDLDELRIFSTCADSDIAGGSINIVGGGVSIDICANDGVSDAFDVEVSGATGPDNTYLVTDENGNILVIANGPTFDLEGAGPGTCFIWHLTSNGPLNGVSVGANVNGITGCYALSNAIAVNRNMQNGGTIETVPGGATDVSICVGDGTSDPIDVRLRGSNASNMAWVITDEDGVILDLPAGPPFDFEGAGTGVCLIWNVSYEGDLEGAEIGNNASDLMGCFGLSNSIRVERNMASAGTISSGGATMFEICALDGVDDIINVEVTGAVGSREAYLITDTDGNIISIGTDNEINADRFGNGTCLIWHISYSGTVNGLNQGANANDITGCFGLSNAITVIKRSTTGGVFSTTDNQTFVSICENNGDPSTVETRLTGAVGANLIYIIADDDGNILEFVMDPSIDFSSYDRGRYFVYAYSYDAPTSGLEIGDNIEDITDSCSGLSNPLVVDRGSVRAGTISSPDGDEIFACVRGPVTDDIEFDITGVDAQFDRWIITDLDGNIIGLPGRPPFGIEVMGSNESCLIWNVAFDSFFVGLSQGNNLSDFEGCFELSNSIRVNKTTAAAGIISTPGGQTSIDLCNGNGSMSIEVVVTDAEGENMAWVITDGSNDIIDIVTGPPFDFSQYGDGDYRIWNLSWSGDLEGAEIGNNASDLDGICFDLSNFISVSSQTIAAGTVSSPLGNGFTVCTRDGQSELLEFDVTGNEGSESRWIVTDANGVIDQLPGSSPFSLDGIPGATCIVYHLSSNGDYQGLNRGRNISELEGCFALSNGISVNKTDVIGGSIETTNGQTEVVVCVGDGVADLVDVTLSGSSGDNTQWVITDIGGDILDLPASPPFDFDGAGVGVCLIWNVSYSGDLIGAEVGNNASDLNGCYQLSNSIRVDRIEVDAGSISSNGATEVEVCIDDPNDVVDVQVTGGATGGNKGWVITDESGEILALPAGPPFSFSGAGTGTCLIWRICYADGLTGAEVGNNASELDGCFDLSDPITVVRLEAGDIVETTSSLKFNLDDCYSDTTDGSNCDYSEFTAEVSNDPACSQFTVLGDHLYRNNPDVNKHSCTPGINGTTAMCVSAMDACDFADDSDAAVRFDIEVTPGSGGTGSISMLSFHEAAPATFNWINGASGVNNYPTRYGIRILKDGVEIYKEDEIETTTDYTLETFDFTGNADFTVTESTVFSFELLGYCLVGANSAVAAWDLDDIMISSTCTSGGGNGCNGNNIVDNEDDNEAETPTQERLAFDIMPNPAEDFMILKANQTPMEGSKVLVYDRMGRVVDTYNITTKELAFDITNYTEGYYYIKMISGGRQITQGFMKL